MIGVLHGGLRLLLICSLAGYMLLAKELLRLQSEFVPVFVFSSLACGVYFAGLAGCLYPGAVVLLAGGVLLAGIYACRVFLRKYEIHLEITLFNILFVISSLFFFYLLYKSRLIHYDNFSHWAVVLKQMLSTDAFPDASSALIDFKNYPLGTSSFIYFICRFAGHSEAIMLIAQGLLIFSCFYAMFGIITEKKRFLLYAFLAAGCSALSVFNITIRISNLLVDFLLPIFTLVIFATVSRYEKQLIKACFMITPVAGLLMIVKSTGTIYAGIGFGYLIFMWLKNRDKNFVKNGAAVLLTIGVALIPWLLWSWHMAAAFKGVENKFDITARQVETLYGGKTPEEVRQIVLLFIQSVFDLKSRPFMGIVAFNLISAGASIFVGVVLKRNWRLWKVLIALDAVVIFYYVGILGLYIFSMPSDEALRLAGFERYASSIVVLFAGGLVLCATGDLERTFYYRIGQVPDLMAFKSVESKGRYQKGVIACIALAVILLMSEFNGMETIRKAYTSTLPYKVWQVTGDRWYSDGNVDESRYLLYATDADGQVTNYYLQYIGKYMLYAPNVDGICAFYEDNMDNLLSGYDYLVLAESDVEARYLLRKHYGVTGGAGVYKVEKFRGEVQLNQIKETFGLLMEYN